MRIHLGLLIIALIACNNVNADYMLRWSPTSGTSFSAPINVDLFLDETAPDTYLVNFGAAGASYIVNLTGVGSLATPVGNPNFDLVNVSGSGSSVTVEQTSILGLTELSGSLKIGSFLINPTGNGSGALSVALFGSLADFSVYDSMLVPQVLDGDVIPAPSFSYSFTAVPEPSSALTGMSLGCLGALYRRRRGRTPE